MREEVATGLPVATSFLDAWRWWIFALLAAATLVPLVIWPGFFFPYVVPRNLFFRVAIEIASALLVVVLLRDRRRLTLSDDHTFIALLLFVIAAGISAAFSPAPTHSYFGDFERMGGVWAWFHLLLFYVLLRALDDRQFRLLLNCAFIVGLLATAYGLVEYQRLWTQARGVNVRAAAITGTFGNSGLLAGYVVVVIALAAFLAARTRRFRGLYLGAAGAGAIALFLTQNRSAVLAIAAGLVAGAAIYSNLPEVKRDKPLARIPFFLVAALLIVAVGMARINPAGSVSSMLPAVFTKGGGSWVDEGRIVQWRAAGEGFRDRPLVGYGIENHHVVWATHFNPDVYKRNEDIFDRTHNQFLEVLATTGLLGFLTFFGIFVAFAYALRTGHRAGRLGATEVSVLAASMIAYCVYLFFWFFDLSAAMLWVILLAIASRAALGNAEPISVAAGVHTRRRAWLLPAAGVACLLLGALYVHAFEPARASRALARIQSGRNPQDEIIRSFDVAYRSMAPQTSLTPIVFAGYIGSLAPQFRQIRANKSRKAQMDHAFQRAIVAFQREIRKDPLNGRLRTYEARVLLLAASYYGMQAYQLAAVQSLDSAIAISPGRIQPRMLMASAALLVNDYERARESLDEAIRLEPEKGSPGYLSGEPGYQRGEPAYQLAKLLITTRKYDSAASQLHTSMRKGFAGAPPAYIAAARHLEQAGRHAEAARLLAAYLETRYSRSIWNPHPRRQPKVDARDVAIAGHLPIVHLRARNTAQALHTSRALMVVDTVRGPLVERFRRDVRAGRAWIWAGRNTLLPCDARPPGERRLRVDPSVCRVFGAPLPRVLPD